MASSSILNKNKALPSLFSKFLKTLFSWTVSGDEDKRRRAERKKWRRKSVENHSSIIGFTSYLFMYVCGPGHSTFMLRCACRLMILGTNLIMILFAFLLSRSRPVLSCRRKVGTDQQNGRSSELSFVLGSLRCTHTHSF